MSYISTFSNGACMWKWRSMFHFDIGFVQDYRNILPLGHVLMWNYSFQLNAWLDDIVYHSFVRYNNKGIIKPWDIILFIYPVTEVKPPQIPEDLNTAIKSGKVRAPTHYFYNF
ncbi:hypothetical protein RHGRI_004875 [Rhododendron griersonianum]|uniref:Uncharacterized protein n=1 Tax=Rhododendron griersonianum TaxID=479676 RepID=A0AAV6LA94_9ERIC|nr:hypothetical protein RHGRI_004875 [Rhododendron griersonianum]KAG5561985.1 hypothetical protein RHGRI_004875 [Rhododendron griersonianum]